MTTDNSMGLERFEASQARKIIIGLIDAHIVILLVIALLVSETPFALYKLLSPINNTFLILICLVIYRLVSFTIFKVTLGMKLYDVILLNGEQQPLSILEKCLASFFILYKGTSYYSRK